MPQQCFQCFFNNVGISFPGNSQIGRAGGREERKIQRTVGDGRQFSRRCRRSFFKVNNGMMLREINESID